jgi:Sigma-70, region 4
VKEMQMARPEAQQAPDDLWHELRPLIDQELSRIPEKYRAPVVLCDLQGQTRKQAAQQLGCPEGTVSGRLARARGMLAKRLARHGLTLSTAAFATALSQGAASAVVQPPLVAATIKAATLVAAGHVTAGAISAPVAALTAGVLQSMASSKIKIALAVLLAVSLLGAGWGVYSSGADDSPKQIPPPAAAVGGGGGGAQAPAAEKFNLPSGPAPVQVLASIDPDGKLLIKRALMMVRPPNAPGGLAPVPPAALPGAGAGAPGLPGGFGRGAPGGAGGGFAPAVPAQFVQQLHAQTYDLDNVEILDTKATKLDRKEVMERLKDETVAMASWSSPVDPLHLRVIKDGTLIFVLPNTGFPGALPPGVPGIPGGAPPAPGGLGGVPPGIVGPPTPAVPVPPGPNQP